MQSMSEHDYEKKPQMHVVSVSPRTTGRLTKKSGGAMHIVGSTTTRQHTGTSFIDSCTRKSGSAKTTDDSGFPAAAKHPFVLACEKVASDANGGGNRHSFLDACEESVDC